MNKLQINKLAMPSSEPIGDKLEAGGSKWYISRAGRLLPADRGVLAKSQISFRCPAPVKCERGVFYSRSNHMAGRGPQSFKKRQREQARKEKQDEKRTKRLQPKEPGTGPEVAEGNPILEELQGYEYDGEVGSEPQKSA
jgi:hypothetical protein